MDLTVIAAALKSIHNNFTATQEFSDARAHYTRMSDYTLGRQKSLPLKLTSAQLSAWIVENIRRLNAKNSVGENEINNLKQLLERMRSELTAANVQFPTDCVEVTQCELAYPFPDPIRELQLLDIYVEQLQRQRDAQVVEINTLTQQLAAARALLTAVKNAE
jgi:hypothetical protein